MDIDQRAPWSGRKLAQLGQSLVDDVDPPANCPSYEHVADWHFDLCSEIATRISSREWTSYRGVFDVSSRAKTIDTLRDKLRRQPHLHLNQVQDLAGVRVDLDGDLDQQTAFAEEVMQFFGVERAEIKDIRATPHSGYRTENLTRTLQFKGWSKAFTMPLRGWPAWRNTSCS